MDFVGAKVVLLCGPDMLTYLRDDKPGLPWAGMWDLPGGGRERQESPEACVLRELHEEFGLHFGPGRLEARWIWPSMTDTARLSAFYAGRITSAEIADIRFCDEGQYWQMMPVSKFLTHPRSIPEMQRRVGVALTALRW